MSLKDRKHSDELLNHLGIECVQNRIQTARLRWFGHVERKRRLGEEMHKDECDRSGGQRCSENVELCRERNEGYGHKGGNGTGPLYLEEYYWGSDPC